MIVRVYSEIQGGVGALYGVNLDQVAVTVVALCCIASVRRHGLAPAVGAARGRALSGDNAVERVVGVTCRPAAVQSVCD